MDIQRDQSTSPNPIRQSAIETSNNPESTRITTAVGPGIAPPHEPPHYVKNLLRSEDAAKNPRNTEAKFSIPGSREVKSSSQTASKTKPSPVAGSPALNDMIGIQQGFWKDAEARSWLDRAYQEYANNGHEPSLKTLANYIYASHFARRNLVTGKTQSTRVVLPDGFLLEKSEQVEWLNQLNTLTTFPPKSKNEGAVRIFAPGMQDEKNKPLTITKALERDPSAAVEYPYTIVYRSSWAQAQKLTNSKRLSLAMRTTDVIDAVQQIISLQKTGNKPGGIIDSMKVWGPAQQMHRYESVIIYLKDDADLEKATQLAEYLHSRIPEAAWSSFEMTGMHRIPGVDGITYGETTSAKDSFGMERANVVAKSLWEFHKSHALGTIHEDDMPRQLVSALETSLKETKFDPENPALILKNSATTTAASAWKWLSGALT